MSPGSKTMGDLNFLIYILFSEFFLINMYYSNKEKNDDSEKICNSASLSEPIKP